jgi:hypothetical protein
VISKKDIIRQINIIESYLYGTHAVQVEYLRDEKDVYYPSLNRVEINSRQNYHSRLHSLLHEAGHVIIRSEKKQNQFEDRFPDMKIAGGYTRGNISHRIDVLREEVLAWEEGEKLATYLGLELDKKKWATHRRAALKSYVEWI